MICPECKGERAVYRCFQNRIKLTPCPTCNGVGEVVVTNFDRITDSPEKLAEWLSEKCSYCTAIMHWQCDKCPHLEECCIDEKKIWFDWLKEESDAE